jgi:hypothetical protein
MRDPNLLFKLGDKDKTPMDLDEQPAVKSRRKLYGLLFQKGTLNNNSMKYENSFIHGVGEFEVRNSKRTWVQRMNLALPESWKEQLMANPDDEQYSLLAALYYGATTEDYLNAMSDTQLTRVAPDREERYDKISNARRAYARLETVTTYIANFDEVLYWPPVKVGTTVYTVSSYEDFKTIFAAFIKVVRGHKLMKSSGNGNRLTV